MATTFPVYADITTNKITVRPHHLRQAAAMMSEAGVAVFSTDKTAVLAAVQALIAAFKAGGPITDPGDFDTAVDALAADIATEISDGFEAGDEYLKSGLLVMANGFDTSNAAITEFDNEDARCQGVGRVPGVTLNSDIVDGSYRDCPSCGGVGRTEDSNTTPTVAWPVAQPDWINNLT